MSRVLRSSLVASVVAIFVVVLLARSTASLVGEGQSRLAAPAPADVAPFVGRLARVDVDSWRTRPPSRSR